MKTTLGVIVGNRGFFPDSVAREGHNEILALLQQEGIDSVCLTPEDTKFGTVETLADARACADLFRKNAGRIDGILVTLPNFGDERGVADTLRLSGLKVPVLVQAYPDQLDKFAIGQRRDSFCGKFSVCANLSQYRIPFSLTREHTVSPQTDSFRQDLRRFGATCRIVRGLRNARFGAIGPRPAAFNSVRYSEKILEGCGITVDVLDLTDVFGRANRMSDSDPRVAEKLQAIQGYVDTSSVPAASLAKMAKFAVVVEDWIRQNSMVGTAIQCWTAIEEYFGIVPCTVMSMMSNALLPSACEVDVTGAIAMYVLQLASGKPSAIVDWNNNYENDRDKCVVFHCSNMPKAFFDQIKMDSHAILAGFVPRENTWGALLGQIKPGPATFLRISTDDLSGKVSAYAAEGHTTADPAKTWGGVGVVHVPRLPELLRYICCNGFEHHVSMNLSHVGSSIVDALQTYLGWSVYPHNIEIL